MKMKPMNYNTLTERMPAGIGVYSSDNNDSYLDLPASEHRKPHYSSVEFEY